MRKTISITSIIVIIGLLFGGFFLAKYLMKKNSSELDTVAIYQNETLDVSMPVYDSPEQANKLTDSQSDRKAYYYDEATDRYFYYVPKMDMYIYKEIISTETTSEIKFWKYDPTTGVISRTSITSGSVLANSGNEINFNFSVVEDN